MQNKKIGVVALLALAVAAPSAAEAAVRLKVAKGLAGDSSYEYEDVGGGSLKLDGDYSPLALNVAFVNDSGGYFDIGYSTSSDDVEIQGGGWPYTYDRNDIALTFGGVTRGFGFFVGLRKGEGEYVTPNTTGAYTLTSTGVVMGMSGQFKPAPKHTVAISGGIGLLTGELEDTQGGNNFSEDADWTFGFSWGLAYSFQAAEKVAVGIEHKSQSYEFEFWPEWPADDYTITESLSNTSLFVSYVF